MKTNILIIHGAGIRSYNSMREKWVPFLKRSLGENFMIIAPEMPSPQFPQYASWREVIKKTLSEIKGPVILVGHSLGAALLLKYLTEEKMTASIQGFYMVAAPYFSADQGWNYRDFFIHKDPSKLLSEFPVYSYHSTDDQIVPVTHQGFLAKKLPKAIIRTLSGQGHEYNKKEFKEIIMDIKLHLHKTPSSSEDGDANYLPM